MSRDAQMCVYAEVASGGLADEANFFFFFQRDRFICRVYMNILLQDAIKFLIVVMERIKEEPCKMIKRNILVSRNQV